MNIPDEVVFAAAKAHTPQFNNMDPTIQKYALEQMSAALTAALPYLQPVDVAAVTRPVTNIESRTPKEVFDIMCDRIRAGLAQVGGSE